jgi:hypothetical protein
MNVYSTFTSTYVVCALVLCSAASERGQPRSHGAEDEQTKQAMGKIMVIVPQCI